MKRSAVFIGSHSLLVSCAELFLANDYDIACILTLDQGVCSWAENKGIKCLAFSEQAAASIGEKSFDYLFSIVHLTRLSSAFLDLPRQAAINFHDGPLPQYAGLNAPAWALINGETRHAVTWHLMTEEFDQGGILKQAWFDVADDETALSLNTKCYEAALATFGQLIADLGADTLAAQPQSACERAYYGKHRRPAAMASLSWSEPAETLAGLVRGLDFGDLPNPMTTPKLWIKGQPIGVHQAEVLSTPSTRPFGSILQIADQGLVVATDSFDLRLNRFASLEGSPITVDDLVAFFHIDIGDRLQSLDDETADAITDLYAARCRHEPFWVDRLQAMAESEPPAFSEIGLEDKTALIEHDDRQVRSLTHSNAVISEDPKPGDTALAAVLAYLLRRSGSRSISVDYRDDRLLIGSPADLLFAPYVPLTVDLADDAAFADLRLGLLEDMGTIRSHGPYARDLVRRNPDLRKISHDDAKAVCRLAVMRTADLPADDDVDLDADLTFVIPDDGRTIRLHAGTAPKAKALLRSVERQLDAMLDSLDSPDRRIGELDILPEDERARLLVDWNQTERAYDRQTTIHRLFEAQVDRTPEAIAMVCGGESLTYAELDRRANQLAHYLVRQGTTPGDLVGVMLDRSLTMITALLAILKAGGAYVPLDPRYPVDRLAMMADDSKAKAILSERHYAGLLPDLSIPALALDHLEDALAGEDQTRLPTIAGANDLAYVIYTSGSTGKPKGVMIEHANVVNFFAGMDDRVPVRDDHDPSPGVWLAVTSISFDISVLELFWTLTRGFKVVLYIDPLDAKASSPSTREEKREDALDFSLFYFASDEGEEMGRGKYRLLLDGARFADRNGFAAIWTPERHFHAFGGLYPNPSLASTAVAAITDRIDIRAGSCVLPLHHVIRVAEEWSFVDNLSNGRVGLSVASGWQPDDFVLRPDKFADRHAAMYQDIETLRRLWRGEAVAFPGALGKDVEVITRPRPVQPELPIWVTAAGNPKTFESAGINGCNLLTHLLGQDTDELAEKIRIYRDAWRTHGHDSEGHVSLMLHSFVGDDIETVRDIVRKPMTDYLRSSVNLIKAAAWTFPTFKKQAGASGKNPLEIFESEDLSDEDMTALLDHAFERYFETSGLFGTPDSCLEMVERLKTIDIDEIACLIDFGVPVATVLDHLDHLGELKTKADRLGPGTEQPSIADLIEEHGVTHMQATPSLVRMLLVDPAIKSAFAKLQTLLVGGEALPLALLGELETVMSGEIVNMYGPTETTIWSSTHQFGGSSETVLIGRPIANTSFFVLDEQMQPVPIGATGELYIGGDGVARGYLHRPELTDERFVDNPFDHRDDARLYRTGDLARYRNDSDVEVLGRADFQVKIRGYRIELGEIESRLEDHALVREAVLLAHEAAAGDLRLIAYLVAHEGADIDDHELRQHLAKDLPDFMLPNQFVRLDQLPLTPNGKVDRKALVLPSVTTAEPKAKDAASPMTPTESSVARIWQDALCLETIARQSHFFELGGHSLLAVRVMVTIRKTFAIDLPLETLFRLPVLTDFAMDIDRSIAKQAADRQALTGSTSREQMADRLGL